MTKRRGLPHTFGWLLMRARTPADKLPACNRTPIGLELWELPDGSEMWLRAWGSH
jgi:hypothetical protein